MRRFPANKEDDGILTVAAQQSIRFLLSTLIDKRYQRLGPAHAAVSTAAALKTRLPALIEGRV
jgi:hypothetical protein